MAGERGDSEENHSDSQDLYHTSLHSDTVSSGPYVEAVLPKDEMNWLWFSYFKQNAVLRLSSPPAPKAWQNLYLGRRIVMELGGSSGNWGAAQLCLRQIQFFFFFLAGGSRSTIVAISPICLFLSPFMLCYSNLLSPKALSGGIMTQKWPLCSSSSSCISYSSWEKEVKHFSLWTMVMFSPPPHPLSWCPQLSKCWRRN